MAYILGITCSLAPCQSRAVDSEVGFRKQITTHKRLFFPVKASHCRLGRVGLKLGAISCSLHRDVNSSSATSAGKTHQQNARRNVKSTRTHLTSNTNKSPIVSRKFAPREAPSKKDVLQTKSLVQNLIKSLQVSDGQLPSKVKAQELYRAFRACNDHGTPLAEVAWSLYLAATAAHPAHQQQSGKSDRKDVRPSSSSSWAASLYNALILAVSQAEVALIAWRRIKQIKLHMESTGAIPNERTSTHIIVAAAAAANSALDVSADVPADVSASVAVSHDDVSKKTPGVSERTADVAVAQVGGISEEIQEIPDALEVYEDLRSGGYPMDSHSFTQLINMCGAGGKHDQARELFASARSMGVHPTPYMISAYLTAHCRSPTATEADLRAALDQIVASGARLDTHSLNAALRVCSLLKAVGRAERLIADTTGIQRPPSTAVRIQRPSSKASRIQRPPTNESTIQQTSSLSSAAEEQGKSKAGFRRKEDKQTTSSGTPPSSPTRNPTEVVQPDEGEVDESTADKSSNQSGVGNPSGSTVQGDYIFFSFDTLSGDAAVKPTPDLQTELQTQETKAKDRNQTTLSSASLEMDSNNTPIPIPETRSLKAGSRSKAKLESNTSDRITSKDVQVQKGKESEGTGKEVRRSGRRGGVSVNAVSVYWMMRTCIEAGRWERGKEWLHHLRGHADMSSYAVLITSLSDMGKMAEAEAVWRESVRAGTPAHSALRTALCTSLASSHPSGGGGKHGQVQPQGSAARTRLALKASLQLLKEYRSKGYPMDSALYNQGVRSLVKSRQMRKALSLFSHAHKEGFRLSQVAVNTLLGGCAGAKLADDAFSVFSRARDDMGVRPDAVMFTSLITACANTHQGERAMEVYAEATGLGFSKDRILVNAVINACAKTGQADTALGLVMTAVGPQGCGLDSYSLTSLLDAFARSGVGLDEAFAARDLGQFLRIPHSTSVVNALMNACAKQGNLERALEVWRQALESEELEDMLENEGEEKQILADVARKRESDGESLGVDTVTMNTLIHACAQAQDVDAAFQVFSEGRALGLAVDAVTLGSLINVCAKVNDVQRALQVYEMAEVYKVKPTSVMVNTIMNAAARSGEPWIATGVLASAKYQGVKVEKSTMNSFIRSFISANNPEQALVAWQLAEWLGLEGTSQTKEDLVSSCKEFGIEIPLQLSLEEHIDRMG